MKINESKKDRYNTSTMGTHVLDIVSDNGDLSLADSMIGRYFPHDIKESRPEWTRRKLNVIGRVRINSEAIIDSLNECTRCNLPTPCIILHPFKVLIDREKDIRTHYWKLVEEDLAERKEYTERATAEARTDSEDASSTETGKPTPPESQVSESHAASTGDHPGKHAEPKDEKSKTKKARKNYKLLHFERLINFMDTYLIPEIDIARKIREHEVDEIAFSHLWHLFYPGDFILKRNIWESDPVQLYQVVKVSGGRPKLQSYGFRQDQSAPPYWQRDADEMYKGKRSAFVIDCFHIDFDGTKFRPVHHTLSIQNYEGMRRIKVLEAMPLESMDKTSQNRLLSTLRMRGRTFLDLTKVKAAHREYTGMSLDAEDKVEIDSRVIVDFSRPEVLKAKEREVMDPNDPVRKLKRVFGVGVLSKTDSRELTEVVGKYPTDADQTLYDDTTYDQERTNQLFATLGILTGQQELPTLGPHSEDLLLLPGQVYGFVIRLREFRALDVTLIRDVRLNKSGFDDLVLPKRHRKLIKALVERHSMGSRPVDEESGDAQPTKPPEPESVDIVRGKGKGLIILLHGVPGVGKTSTAETIADATARPLLPVTCGDIGETAEEVEKSLARTFSLAHRWGCVLLMDEADVFLSKRRKEDMRRNAVVSVFLRVLEYYSGILFLTTNRVGTIDEAFKSRIHISLYYPPLDWRTTKEIYSVNLRRARSRVDYDESAILRFAKKHFHNNEGANRWNGRQIFNAFQTAIALAEYDNLEQGRQASGTKAKLMEEHFKEVAKTSRKFEDYLHEVHGGEDDAQINAMERIRADLWGLDDIASPLPTRKKAEKSKKKFDSSDMPSTTEGSEDESSPPQTVSEDSEESEKQRKGKKKARDRSGERKRKSKRNQAESSSKAKKTRKAGKAAKSTESEDE